MKVIWKRPDGFHEAAPSDYTVVEVSQHSKIWLHKRDQENYPFRVSGGWQDEDASQKLNRLVNLIPQPSKEWVLYLTELFNHSTVDSPQNFIKNQLDWLDELAQNLKGDTWEIEIMDETLKELKKRLALVTESFLQAQ